MFGWKKKSVIVERDLSLTELLFLILVLKGLNLKVNGTCNSQAFIKKEHHPEWWMNNGAAIQSLIFARWGGTLSQPEPLSLKTVLSLWPTELGMKGRASSLPWKDWTEGGSILVRTRRDTAGRAAGRGRQHCTSSSVEVLALFLSSFLLSGGCSCFSHPHPRLPQYPEAVWSASGQ